MRLFSFILVIGYLFHFATGAAEKDPVPAVEAFQIEIKKDDADFSGLLEMIVSQASYNLAAAELTTIPGSLKDAWSAMKKDDQFKGVRCYAERDDWYIFSTMPVDKAAPKPNPNLIYTFFSGFALKKGTNKVLQFRFCW